MIMGFAVPGETMKLFWVVVWTVIGRNFFFTHTCIWFTGIWTLLKYKHYLLLRKECRTYALIMFIFLSYFFLWRINRLDKMLLTPQFVSQSCFLLAQLFLNCRMKSVDAHLFRNFRFLHFSGQFGYFANTCRLWPFIKCTNE